MIREPLANNAWKLIISIFFSAASAFVSVGMIAFVNSHLINYTTDDILTRIFIFSACLIGMFAISFLAQVFLIRVSSGILYRLRVEMVNRILNMDFTKRMEIGNHKIYATITNDVSSLSEAITLIPVFVYHLLTIILCFAYFIYLSPMGFWLLFLTVATALIISKLLIAKGMKVFNELRENTDNVFSLYKCIVDGKKELALDEKRSSYLQNQQLKPELTKMLNNEIRAKTYWSLNQSFSNVMLFIAIGILIFSSYYIESISKEILDGFILGIVYLVGPLLFIVNASQSFSIAKIAYKKVNSLELFSRDNTAVSEGKLQQDWRCIRAVDLYYKYDSDSEGFAFDVGPINLDIEKGKIVFICGSNGSGKSTLVSLIVGLIRPSSGNLFVDDIKVDQKHSSAYRSKFQPVFSDFYLFDRVLDKSGGLADDELTRKHLKILKLDQKVSVNNGVLSSIDLSQGQKKRLGLLLSLVRDPDVYVFDEWAADQDPYFRHLFYTSILPNLRAAKKTVFVVSHDEKYFDCADELIYMEQGRIQKYGKEDISSEITGKIAKSYSIEPLL